LRGGSLNSMSALSGPSRGGHQCLHQDDLAGYLIEHGGWHHLDLPAGCRQAAR